MSLNLQRIADAVAGAPDFDASRVETVKQALSRGTLEIDRRRIADKLMDLDTALRRRG